MVDLGGRLDAFFEQSRIARTEHESFKDCIDRFEDTYQKVTAVGDSLSHKSQAHRLAKGMKLDRRDWREMLQLAGGWGCDKRIYSPYVGRSALSYDPASASHPARLLSTRSNSSAAGSSRASSSLRSSGRFARVNAADTGEEEDDDEGLTPVDEEQFFEGDARSHCQWNLHRHCTKPPRLFHRHIRSTQ